VTKKLSAGALSLFSGNADGGAVFADPRFIPYAMFGREGVFLAATANWKWRPALLKMAISDCS
jgi:hypothetical protein